MNSPNDTILPLRFDQRNAVVFEGTSGIALGIDRSVRAKFRKSRPLSRISQRMVGLLITNPAVFEIDRGGTHKARLFEHAPETILDELPIKAEFRLKNSQPLACLT